MNTYMDAAQAFLTGKHGMKTPHYSIGGALKKVGDWRRVHLFQKTGKALKRFLVKRRIELSLSLRETDTKEQQGNLAKVLKRPKEEEVRSPYTGLVDLARQQRMEEAEAAACC